MEDCEFETDKLGSNGTEGAMGNTWQTFLLLMN
jgi:hypothetical protein